jgi:ribosomal protein S18 acetylase RimI-like enzyme
MIKIIENIESVYPLIKQLRPNLTLEQFVQIHDKAKAADQYRLWGYFENNLCVGLMGLRTLFDFVHLKHLYIDDLVVDSAKRSSGIGAKLLKHAEELGRQSDCLSLRLSTGVENQGGIRFYQKEKWTQRALIFKKKL